MLPAAIPIFKEKIEMKTWLTVKEAAPVLKMSEQGLYSAVRERQLTDAAILRIGRRIRIDPTRLTAPEGTDKKRDSDRPAHSSEVQNGRK